MMAYIDFEKEFSVHIGKEISFSVNGRTMLIGTLESVV